MEKERATYTKTVPDNLVQIVGGMKYAGVALLAIRLNAFAEGDEARVSIPKLCEIYSCSVNTIKEYARRLAMLDIWHLKTIHGRGNIAVWKKGSKFDTFTTLKQSNFDGFITVENHQTLTKKPSNFDGYNIDYNIEDGGRARVRASEPSPKEKLLIVQGDTPCDPRKISTRMNDSNKFPFEKFWTAFKPAPEYEYERESCEQQWALMSDNLRENVLKTLSSRRRHKPNPHWFLFDYKPTEVQPEFPIFRNSDAALGKAMKEAESGGQPIANVVAGEQLHISDKFAFVYLKDAQKHGLTINWTVPKNAQQTQVNNQ